ncbi:penicillin acylase family protein [Salinispirillum sp. LH 10-3-1]|uniref:Penicillin acylase family protein n=1 Tax=Salinispirillum sp. LH 10-3-1 TaxID=2952525 RepID=A0AB38YD05_9GAMM
MKLRNAVKWTRRALAAALVIVVAGAGFLYWQLTGSLAQLNGEVQHASLTAPVMVERDAQGIPRIIANHRPDTAFALGYLHAQERFFQMDLLRRNSAGEMSGMFGDVALNYDKRLRLHQFRKRGEAAVAALPEDHKATLDAYVEGVNAGLNGLRSKPFEYHLLGITPEPWQTADTMLALYSMYLDLQPNWNEQENSRAVMRDLLPEDWYAFLQPQGGEWDAPIHGAPFIYTAPVPERSLAAYETTQQVSAYQYRDGVEIGSNSWSAAGARTAYTSGMVANDMHLGLRVPNIWYRATWNVPGYGREISGATLPGTPAMVVGSNQHIAWAFTNSNGDYHDTIVLQTRNNDSEYLTPDGWQAVEMSPEVITIKGGESVTVEIPVTRWGPIIGEDHNGNAIVMRWVAHDVEGANLMLMNLEHTNTVFDALPIAAQSGVPGQNFVVVDRAGNQAWSIMGRLPKRSNEDFDGRLPMDWSDGTYYWDGYLDPSDYPAVINPAIERIWTGNSRMVSDQLLEKVGQAEYALGARQQQIRNRLLQQPIHTEQDFLDIQMDDQAVFLERWQAVLSSVLDDPTSAEMAEMQAMVDDWSGHAAKDDVGYWLVKRFREKVIDQTVGEIFRYLEGQVGQVFSAENINRYVEYPVWQLITEEPDHHLPTGHDSWQSFLYAVAEATLADVTANGAEPLSAQTWGRINTLAIEHPLANNVPVFGRFLKMPAEPMNGDTFMPLVQRPTTGASQRLVVAPGHEDNGIFHMATGQSAHPLSPFYDRGHRDWVDGQPSPLLPGEARHTLTFLP